MLNIWGQSGRLCDGINRRQFIKAGTLAGGALTLADRLRLKSLGSPTGGQPKTNDSMVFTSFRYYPF